MENLTPKQEKFVMALINGMSQRQAYKFAYNIGSMKDVSIDAEACKLFKKDKIQIRYNQLIKEKQQKKSTKEDLQSNSQILTQFAKEEMLKEYESPQDEVEIVTYNGRIVYVEFPIGLHDKFTHRTQEALNNKIKVSSIHVSCLRGEPEGDRLSRELDD